jgi:CHAT domain-containing protein
MTALSRVLLGLATLEILAACTRPPTGRPPAYPAHSVLSVTLSPVDLPPDAYAYDPRSDPAKASAAAEQQIAQGVRDVQRARFLFEMARAVASGGDYARAIRIAGRATDWAGLPPNYRFVLGDAVRLWRTLRLSSDGMSNDFSDDIEPEVMLMGAEVWPKLDRGLDEQQRAACAKMRLLRTTSSQLPIAESLKAATGSRPDKLLEAAPDLCSADLETCPLRGMINVQLRIRAQLLDQAQLRAREQQRTLAATGDERGAALFEMLEADTLSAPNSSPLMLNLRPFNHLQAKLSLGAGLDPAEYRPIGAASLARARALYQRAGATFKRIGFRRGLALLEARMGYLAFAESRFDDSVSILTDATQHLDESGDVMAGLWVRMGTIASWLALDRRERAEELVLGFADRTRQLELPGVASAAVEMLADLAQFLTVERGHAHAAASALELAKALASRAALPLAGLKASYAAADYVSDLGRFDDAVQLFQELLATADRLRLSVQSESALTPLVKESRLRAIDMSRLQTLFALKEAYVGLGDPEGARKYNTGLRMLAATNAGDTTGEVAGLLAQSSNFNSVAVKSPAKPSGSDKTRQSAASTDPDDNDWHLLLVEGRLADAAAAAGASHDEIGQALAYWAADQRAHAKTVARSRAQSLLNALPQSPSASPSGMDLLQLQAKRSDIELAISVLAIAEEFVLARTLWQRAEQSAGAPILFKQRSQEWERDQMLAEIAAGLGETQLAAASYNQALARFEAFAASTGTEYERAGLYEKASSLHRDVARFYLRTGNYAKALEVFESTRARSFRAQLFSRLSEHPGAARSEAVQAWIRAQARLAALRRLIVRDGSVPETAQALKDAESDLARAEIGVTSKLQGAVSDPRPATGYEVITRAAHALSAGPNALVAYFFFNNSEAYALVITREGLRGGVRLQSSTQAVRVAVGQLLGKVSQQRSDWEDEARTLHQALLRPVQSLLPARQARTWPTIGFITYGALEGVPFHLMMDKSRPLLADYNVFYLPSLQSYSALVDRSTSLSTRDIYAFGYNGGTLQRAESEAGSVAKDPEHAFLGKTATTANFEAKATSDSIIHLSMHALTSRRDPFQAKLVFADRLLRLDEVLGMRVGAQLMTLNVCDADAGYTSSAGEHVSLARAFLTNGVPSVVTSEWPVVDRPEMSGLFNAFYAYLRRGMAPVEALGTAERDLLGKNRGAAWEWGAFQLVGSDR